MMRPPFVLGILSILMVLTVFWLLRPEAVPKILVGLVPVTMVGTSIALMRILLGWIRDRHKTRIPPRRYSLNIPNYYLPEILFLAAVLAVVLLLIALSRGWILLSLFIWVILFKDPHSRP